MQVKVYNKSGEEAGVIELPSAIFAMKWNAELVRQVIDTMRANRRTPVAHVKDRSEVRGGGRKPWRQKGTGRARHGSTRSPIWAGGGVTHGPNKNRNLKKLLNKKMAKRALFTVLSAKARENEVIVVEGMQFKDAKTKGAALFFSALARQDSLARMAKGNGVLVAMAPREESAVRAMRNIPFVQVSEMRNLNAYDVMQYKYILFQKEALAALK